MNQRIPKIAESEWRIMKILWKESPLTASEIIHRLKETIHWNPKTVKTLLNRLVTKGALSFNKEGRIYHYSPAVSESECAQVESRSFLNRVYDGALKPMLAAFIEDQELSPIEIEELKQILDKEKGKGK
jgi:BlaI family penicillinase repressor